MQHSDANAPSLIPEAGKHCISSVRSFVEAMLRSRSDLEACGSSTGHQLETAELFSAGRSRGGASKGGMHVHATHGAGSGVQDRLARHAVYTMIWCRLADEEQILLELQHRPLRFFRLERQLRPCDLRSGGAEQYLGPCGDDATRARYLVTEPVFPRDAELADALACRGFRRSDGLPYSDSQIRRRIKRANAKIRENALFMLLEQGEQ